MKVTTTTLALAAASRVVVGAGHPEDDEQVGEIDVVAAARNNKGDHLLLKNTIVVSNHRDDEASSLTSSTTGTGPKHGQKDTSPSLEKKEEPEDPFERFDSKKAAIQRGLSPYDPMATWEETPEHRHRHVVGGIDTSTSNSKSKQPKASSSSSSSKGPKSCKDSKTKNPSEKKSSKSPSSKSPKSSGDDVCEDDDKEPTNPPTVMPTPRILCPAPPMNPQCFTGSPAEIIQQCTAAGANCCVDGNTLQACSGFNNATICEGSCQGDIACQSIAENSYIGPNSCVGDQACASLGGYSDNVVVQGGSCNGVDACLSLGGTVYSILVGPNACVGTSSSCVFVGKYISSSGSIDIAACACRAQDACNYFGGDLIGDENITIGYYACNGTSLCDGSSATGTAECKSASGSYGVNLPPFATGCSSNFS